MTRYAFALFFILVFATACTAADVKFGWDYTQGTDPAEGFELQISTVPAGVPVYTQDCPGADTRQCIVAAVPKGTYYARAYAYSVDAVDKRYSGSSNEVQFSIKNAPSSVPVNLSTVK